MKRAFLTAVVAAVLMHSFLGAQAPPPQATGLTFFKNYFITGDYVVGGVNLRQGGSNGGLSTGVIDLTTLTNADIPDNADVVAAFLYWETVETANSANGADGATLQGNVDPTSLTFDAAGRNDIGGIAKVINPTGTSPCWAAGGGTGGSDGAHQEFTRRADVLKFIPINPVTGRYVVKTHYEVRIPDSGNGNQSPSTAGASLLIIWKDPSKPLKSIVIYNGGYTMDQSTQQMTRTLSGFYQAGISPGISSISAKMTHIVGNGSSKGERLLFGSGDTATNLIANNPFQGLVTPSTDPAWDNYTFDASPSQDASSVTTTVDRVGYNTFDCLTWGAIVFSTTVQDTDNDGLLDVWESAQNPNSPLKDPNGRQLPNLYAMDARPDHKDLFVEAGALTTIGYNRAGSVQPNVPPHSHAFTQAAIDLVGDAFKNAPVTNPDSINGIKLHIDVGNKFQSDQYVIKFKHPNPNNPNNEQTCAAATATMPSPDADCYARGGEEVEELDTLCIPSPANNFTCEFSNYPGTIGWKRGFAAIRDEALNYPDETSCSAAEQQWTNYRTGATTIQPAIPDCIRRFDHAVRRDMFRYALSVHGIGFPRLDATGNPILDSTGSQIPRNVSGTSDGGGWGGGDLEVALGFWDNFIGTDFMQGSTFMHELGHTFRFRHGGPSLFDPTTGTFRPEPNCKPNYESVMSYGFQMSGLLCDPLSPSPQCTGKPPGFAVIDYSRQDLVGSVNLNENSLTEANTPELAGRIYRTRWFSPTSTLAVNQNIPAASRHCDGTALKDGEIGLYRIDGIDLTNADWNGNLVIDAGTNLAGQDVNFNGGPNTIVVPSTSTDGPFTGYNDWANIDLRQTGSRRNITASDGLLSVDQGLNDNGLNDNGLNDNGLNDNGLNDNGLNDNGLNDNGLNDNGLNDNGAPLGEVDLNVARAHGNPVTLFPPTLNNKKQVVLTWTQTHVDSDKIVAYYVYRVTGASVDQTTIATTVLVGNPVTPPTLTTTDTTAKNNTTYTYWVQVLFSVNQQGNACAVGESCFSGVSDFQTILVK
jgi:hypothetical protein